MSPKPEVKKSSQLNTTVTVLFYTAETAAKKPCHFWVVKIRGVHLLTAMTQPPVSFLPPPPSLLFLPIFKGSPGVSTPGKFWN